MNELRQHPAYQNVKIIKGPTIPLVSGNYFDFLDPDAASYSIMDVAWNLSNICRSGGGVNPFYSVAQHLVHASQFAPAEFALEALLHDAHEFVVGDMVKPLKILCPDYCRIEERIFESVMKRFGVITPLPDVIKEVDRRMLATEQQQLYSRKVRADTWHESTGGAPPYDFTIPIWGPPTAYQSFVARYHELLNKRQAASWDF